MIGAISGAAGFGWICGRDSASCRPSWGVHLLLLLVLTVPPSDCLGPFESPPQHRHTNTVKRRAGHKRLTLSPATLCPLLIPCPLFPVPPTSGDGRGHFEMTSTSLRTLHRPEVLVPKGPLAAVRPPNLAGMACSGLHAALSWKIRAEPVVRKPGLSACRAASGPSNDARPEPRRFLVAPRLLETFEAQQAGKDQPARSFSASCWPQSPVTRQPVSPLPSLSPTRSNPRRDCVLCSALLLCS